MICSDRLTRRCGRKHPQMTSPYSKTCSYAAYRQQMMQQSQADPNNRTKTCPARPSQHPMPPNLNCLPYHNGSHNCSQQMHHPYAYTRRSRDRRRVSLPDHSIRSQRYRLQCLRHLHPIRPLIHTRDTQHKRQERIARIYPYDFGVCTA
jgi:hypothetical protein